MSQHTKKYQVFISSTYEDLKEERAAVVQTLLEEGCIPMGMEQFPASDMNPMEYIKMMLEDCDYFVLILAGRYGSLVYNEEIGYTEKEYDYAISNGIPVMSFILKDIDSLPARKRESTKKNHKKLLKFRNKVSTGKMTKEYSSKEELQRYVASSLRESIKITPRIGWVRADSVQHDDEIINFEFDDGITCIDQDTGKSVKSITVRGAANSTSTDNKIEE